MLFVSVFLVFKSQTAGTDSSAPLLLKVSEAFLRVAEAPGHSRSGKVPTHAPKGRTGRAQPEPLSLPPEHLCGPAPLAAAPQPWSTCRAGWASAPKASFPPSRVQYLPCTPSLPSHEPPGPTRPTSLGHCTHRGTCLFRWSPAKPGALSAASLGPALAAPLAFSRTHSTMSVNSELNFSLGDWEGGSQGPGREARPEHPVQVPGERRCQPPPPGDPQAPWQVCAGQP